MQSNLSSSLLMGVPSIDQEHEVLLEHLSFLISNPRASEPAEHITEVLSRLTVQLIAHFNSEEAVMRDIGLPPLDIAKHMDAHNAIIEQITQLSIELMARAVVDRDRVIVAVRDWIVAHLMEHDVVIRQYLAA